ncbi:type II toxin-antitoxin system YafQ family toxin [Bifidobacterium sp. CP2]|uniref:type II toxin-antitoxin system RelE/ParE family toxin n=1 Tax=Bifidobacterium TaxID=1678 RepID=UPI001BDBBEFF|nr:MULTISPECIES: type II toxin-antitoxin system YafQ family toxin [Bifidobacterium]MBT1182270.1 type II toxin-antitoxin system YafQ family toxin [Bifidobacterium sp. CP2]MBW3080722.1 type II toxin-antitoxin system YafQ family toxin [Bifidobacterium saguinibicoloris]
MSYIIKFDSRFDADYEWLGRVHPELLDDLDDAILMLREDGELPEGYRPHVLGNAGGNYNGHWEFHLAGDIDVLVLYWKRAGHTVIRMVRIGTHAELFQGEVL